jgi:hypothetical protein
MIAAGILIAIPCVDGLRLAAASRRQPIAVRAALEPAQEHRPEERPMVD